MQEAQEEHLRLLLPLFKDHLPEKLVDVAFERVPTTLPPQYLRNAMASCLACRVVYKEGEREKETEGVLLLVIFYFRGGGGGGVAIALVRNKKTVMGKEVNRLLQSQIR